MQKLNQMEIKVREITDVPEKGVAEIEQELLNKHEQQNASNNENPPIQTESNELKEEDVLSYIGNRYNKKINSFDELMDNRNSNEELPEDVASFLKYKKETGRSIQDFLKLQEDFNTMDEDDMLRNYFRNTEDGLDDDDIDSLMDEFRYDEDLDEESDIKKAKLAKKKAIVKARSYFVEQQEKYKKPLESSSFSIPDEDKEEYESYKKYIKESNTILEEQNKKREWFQKKTDELFNQDFKGFEFNLNDKKLVYSPGDVNEIKKSQLNPLNFINKYLDENGLINDAVGYHRSLSLAMNPDKFAKFFYEQGKSDATEDLTRKIKNVNMSERKSPEAINKGGVQIREVNSNSGRGLKIKSAKKI